MATDGEVPGRLPGSAVSEHLNNRICQPCLAEDNLIDATGMCVDCQDYLCLKCLDDHKAQKHRVHDREQLHRPINVNPEDACSDQCPDHENQVIQYYCANHSDLLCKLCKDLYHATCDEVHYIPNISKDLVNNVDYKQAEIHLKLVLRTYMNVFRNCQQNSDEVDKSFTDTLRKVQDFERRMKEVLTKIRRELLNIMQTLRLKAERESAEMTNKYKAAHAELQSSLANIEYLKNTNQNSSSYIEMMKTKEKMKSLDDQTKHAEVDRFYRQRPIQFTPNTELLEVLKNSQCFGTVSAAGTLNVVSGSDDVYVPSDTGSSLSDDFTVLSNETVPSFSDDFSVITDTGSRISQPSLRTENINLWLRTVSNLQGSDAERLTSGSAFRIRDYYVQDLNVKTESDTFKCHTTGMIVLPCDRLVLTDFKNGRIKAVDVQTGQTVVELELESGPWDITIIEKNKVAVTMPLRHTLAFITCGNDDLSIDRTIIVGGQCSGVDYRNGKLAMSFCDSHTIQILNLHGSVLHIINSDILENAIFNFPYYLTFGQDDTILYVSNHMDNNVLCLKMDGTVVATYRDRDLRYPRNVVVDRSGTVYVCAQGSNTIHQITKDCKKLRILLTHTDVLQWPYSICLSEEEDKLYIGMWGDNVKVYRT